MLPSRGVLFFCIALLKILSDSAFGQCNSELFVNDMPISHRQCSIYMTVAIDKNIGSGREEIWRLQTFRFPLTVSYPRSRIKTLKVEFNISFNAWRAFTLTCFFYQGSHNKIILALSHPTEFDHQTEVKKVTSVLLTEFNYTRLRTAAPPIGQQSDLIASSWGSPAGGARPLEIISYPDFVARSPLALLRIIARLLFGSLSR